MSGGYYNDADTGDGSNGTFDSTEGISAYFVLFSGLLALVLVLSKLLHDRPRLASVLPEAGMILLVGMLAGSVVNLFVAPRIEQQSNDDDGGSSDVADSLLSFSPNTFFFVLLPPIIFNSGYHIRRELFFRHLLPISLFAGVGTIISALSIAFILDLVVNAGWTSSGEGEVALFRPHMTELLTFGALISATDPVSTLAVFQAKKVDPQLFYLVFGESVLNDAVGLVLFKAFAKFVRQPQRVDADDDYGESGAEYAGEIAFSFVEFIFAFSFDALLSPILGLFCCICSALIFKHVNMSRSKLLELSLYVLIIYVPFLLAELLHLSGIVTILFSGMAAKSFVVPNLSVQTAASAEQLFRVAAHLAETSIFLELGLSVFGLAVRNFVGSFVGWAVLACFVSRALNVYPLTFVHNRMLQMRQPTRTLALTRSGEGNNEDDPDNVDLDSISSNKKINKHHQRKQQPQVQIVEMTDSLANADHHQAEEMYLKAGSRGGSAQFSATPDNNDEINFDTADSGSPGGCRVAIMKRQDTDLSSVTPKHKRDMKIPAKTAHMLWFSGLRGAVAYACVKAFPDALGHHEVFIVTTMVIVLFTVFCMGGTTTMMLRLLKIQVDVDESKYMEDWHTQRKPGMILRRVDEIVNKWLDLPRLDQDDRDDIFDDSWEEDDKIVDGRAPNSAGHRRPQQDQETNDQQLTGGAMSLVDDRQPPINVPAPTKVADIEAKGCNRRDDSGRPPTDSEPRAHRASIPTDRRKLNRKAHSDGSLFDFGGNEFGE